MKAFSILLLSVLSLPTLASDYPDLHCHVAESTHMNMYGTLFLGSYDVPNHGPMPTQIVIDARGRQKIFKKVFYSNYRTGDKDVPFYNRDGIKAGTISGHEDIILRFEERLPDYHSNEVNFYHCNRLSNAY